MKNKRTILFYLGHPAHYHNISHVIPALAEKGHQIILFARGKDVLFDLIKSLPYKKFLFEDRKREGSKISLIKAVLRREWQLFKITRKHNIDLLIGTDIVITHIGKIMRIPSLILNEDDADAVPLLAKYGFKFSTYTLSPKCCDISPYGHKKISYDSYHELAYLHPNQFEPNIDIVHKYLNANSNYFILRFAKLTAHHDEGILGINDKIALRIIDILKPYGRIIITSERILSNDLEPFRLKIDPKDMHHIMAFADLYIGDSQTMAAEAGVLGTPFIRFNDFVGRLGYLEELENKYELGFGIKPSDPEKLFKKINDFLKLEDKKKEYNQKRIQMLKENIDFASFLIWFIDEYPKSVTTIKANPDYQNNFRTDLKILC